MLRDLGGWHLLIILGIIILLFGSTKLPSLARGVGQSLRIFKSEMKADERGKQPSAPGATPPATGAASSAFIGPDGVTPTTGVSTTPAADDTSQAGTNNAA